MKKNKFIVKNMIDEDISYMMLHELDFPSTFTKKSHKDDYKIINYPIKELIYHRKNFHNRIFVRISIFLRNDVFVPVTFICDTGAPMFLYITELTRSLISERIEVDESENDFINIFGEKKMMVNSSPPLHSDTNVIGLRALSYFGLHLTGNDNFEFDNLPEWF